jgi:DNA invertase Pin-like site-specific DNA recombinase
VTRCWSPREQIPHAPQQPRGQKPLLYVAGLSLFSPPALNLRRDRQIEGIAKAMAAGVYKERPPSIEASPVRELKAQGVRGWSTSQSH